MWIGAAGDVETQIANDLRPQVYGLNQTRHLRPKLIDLLMGRLEGPFATMVGVRENRSFALAVFVHRPFPSLMGP